MNDDSSLLSTTHLRSEYPKYNSLDSKFRYKYENDCKIENLHSFKNSPKVSFSSVINDNYKTLLLFGSLSLYAAVQIRNFWDHEFKSGTYYYENAELLYNLILKSMSANRYKPNEQIKTRFGHQAVKIVEDGVLEGLIGPEDEVLVVKKLIPVLKNYFSFYTGNSIIQPFVYKDSYRDLFKIIEYLSLYTSSVGVIAMLYSSNIYTKLTDIQKTAYYELGATLEEAEKFVNWYQIEALKTQKVTIKQALEFKTCTKLKALTAGALIEDTLKFNNIYQLAAFEKIKDVEVALKFNNSYQILALDKGLPEELALQFNDRGNLKISINKTLEHSSPEVKEKLALYIHEVEELELINLAKQQELQQALHDECAKLREMGMIDLMCADY